MSVKVNYKGEEILSADTDITKTLKTSGKYCEGDIEIVNTQDGGDNPLLYAKSVSFQGKVLPRNFVVTLGDGVTDLNSMFYGTNFLLGTEPKEITVKANGIITNLNSTFFMSKVQVITLDFDTSSVTTWTTVFGQCYNLVTINGELDFSSMSSSTWGVFRYITNTLANVTLKPNTLSNSMEIGSKDLTNASLVSIANGLNEVATEQTLTLHATPKATCSTIMGTVEFDPTGTYHIFTASESGTVTLENFITQTKGWTIA